MNKRNQVLLLIGVVILLIAINYSFLDKTLMNFLGESKFSGAMILTTDPKVVCTSGYSASVRDVSLELKKQLYKMNGLSYPQPRGTVQVDHIIPLELGGSNNIRNLQVEMKEPRPGYLEKERVENYLHRLVCTGNMELEEAQIQIATNWTEIYEIVLKK